MTLAHQPDRTPCHALCPAPALSICDLAHAVLSSILPAQILTILSDTGPSLPNSLDHRCLSFLWSPQALCLHLHFCTTVICIEIFSLLLDSWRVSLPGLEFFRHSTFIECLLCACHCSRYGDTAVNRANKAFIPTEVTFYWEWEGDHPQANKHI